MDDKEKMGIPIPKIPPRRKTIAPSPPRSNMKVKKKTLVKTVKVKSKVKKKVSQEDKPRRKAPMIPSFITTDDDDDESSGSENANESITQPKMTHVSEKDEATPNEDCKSVQALKKDQPLRKKKTLSKRKAPPPPIPVVKKTVITKKQKPQRNHLQVPSSPPPTSTVSKSVITKESPPKPIRQSPELPSGGLPGNEANLSSGDGDLHVHKKVRRTAIAIPPSSRPPKMEKSPKKKEVGRVKIEGAGDSTAVGGRGASETPKKRPAPKRRQWRTLHTNEEKSSSFVITKSSPRNGRSNPILKRTQTIAASNSSSFYGGQRTHGDSALYQQSKHMKRMSRDDFDIDGRVNKRETILIRGNPNQLISKERMEKIEDLKKFKVDKTYQLKLRQAKLADRAQDFQFRLAKITGFMRQVYAFMRSSHAKSFGPIAEAFEHGYQATQLLINFSDTLDYGLKMAKSPSKCLEEFILNKEKMAVWQGSIHMGFTSAAVAFEKCVNLTNINDLFTKVAKVLGKDFASFNFLDLLYFFLKPVDEFVALCSWIETDNDMYGIDDEYKTIVDELNMIRADMLPLLAKYETLKLLYTSLCSIDGFPVYPSVITTSSSFLKEASLNEIDVSKNRVVKRYCYLLSDIFVVTKPIEEDLIVWDSMSSATFGTYRELKRQRDIINQTQFVYLLMNNSYIVHNLSNSDVKTHENVFQLIPRLSSTVLWFNCNAQAGKDSWINAFFLVPDILSGSKHIEVEELEGDMTVDQDKFNVVVDSKFVENIPFAEETNTDFRGRVIQEIVDTEESYVGDLQIIVHVFMGPCYAILSKDEIVSIFSNMQMIYNVNQMFSIDLRELVDNIESAGDAISDALVGGIFLEKAAYFKMYTQYCSNQEKSTNSLVNIRKSNKVFDKFLNECMGKPECRNLGLLDFLIKPMQRITKYPLLLRELLKYTSKDHPDYENLSKAYEKVHEVSLSINEFRRADEKSEKILSIREKLDGLDGKKLQIVTATRVLVREGLINKSSKSKVQERYFWLFNDILMYAKPKSGGRYLYKGYLDLAGAVVSSFDEPIERNKTKYFAFQIIPTNSVKKYLFYLRTREDMESWTMDVIGVVKHHKALNKLHMRD